MAERSELLDLTQLLIRVLGKYPHSLKNDNAGVALWIQIFNMCRNRGHKWTDHASSLTLYTEIWPTLKRTALKRLERFVNGDSHALSQCDLNILEITGSPCNSPVNSRQLQILKPDLPIELPSSQHPWFDAASDDIVDVETVSTEAEPASSTSVNIEIGEHSSSVNAPTRQNASELKSDACAAAASRVSAADSSPDPEKLRNFSMTVIEGAPLSVSTNGSISQTEIASSTNSTLLPNSDVISTLLNDPTGNMSVEEGSQLLEKLFPSRSCQTTGGAAVRSKWSRVTTSSSTSSRSADSQSLKTRPFVPAIAARKPTTTAISPPHPVEYRKRKHSPPPGPINEALMVALGLPIPPPPPPSPYILTPSTTLTSAPKHHSSAKQQVKFDSSRESSLNSSSRSCSSSPLLPVKKLNSSPAMIREKGSPVAAPSVALKKSPFTSQMPFNSPSSKRNVQLPTILRKRGRPTGSSTPLLSSCTSDSSYSSLSSPSRSPIQCSKYSDDDEDSSLLDHQLLEKKVELLELQIKREQMMSNYYQLKLSNLRLKIAMKQVKRDAENK